MMAQAARLVSGWCPVRCDRVSTATAAAIRVFNWTEPDITPHRAGPLFGCTRRHLSSHTTKINGLISQQLLARSPTYALQALQRFHFGFTPLISKTYSSMVSTPQAAHAAAQQQSQGALVWIDCEVLSASPLLIAFLIANVSPRSHAVFK